MITPEDAITATIANISRGLKLPVWTTSDFAFLPVTIPDVQSVETNMSWLSFTVTGYGADLDCENLLARSSTVESELTFHDNGTTYRLW